MIRPPEKLDKQPTGLLGLFLLNPVTRAVDHVYASQVRASPVLHLLESTRTLITAPVAGTGDEDRRLVNGTIRKELLLGGADTAGPIPVQTALETGAAELLAVDPKLVVRQPVVSRDLLG